MILSLSSLGEFLRLLHLSPSGQAYKQEYKLHVNLTEVMSRT